MPELHDKALGAYLGLALGDALGATVEFMTPREIALRFAAHGGVHREIIGGGWLKLQAGQVTDDTTMSLALGEALLQSQRQGRLFDSPLMAEAFVAWWRGKPVDCGNACRRGIQRYLRDGSLAGPQQDSDGGNGALMRNLPVALATLGDDALFDRVSLSQAHITHHNPNPTPRCWASAACCARWRAAPQWPRWPMPRPHAPPHIHSGPIPGVPAATSWTPCRPSCTASPRMRTSKRRSRPPSTWVTTRTPLVRWWACSPVRAVARGPCRSAGCAGCCRRSDGRHSAEPRAGGHVRGTADASAFRTRFKLKEAPCPSTTSDARPASRALNCSCAAAPNLSALSVPARRWSARCH